MLWFWTLNIYIYMCVCVCEFDIPTLTKSHENSSNPACIHSTLSNPPNILLNILKASETSRVLGVGTKWYSIPTPYTEFAVQLHNRLSIIKG